MNSTELITAAQRIGSDPLLVQGAGGNLSEKRGDGSIAIKASGTRLKDAGSRQIFAVLDVEQARTQVLVREDLSDLVDDESRKAGLRPSIETSIHTLLPHRFVFHVHAVGTIAAGSSVNPAALEPLHGLARVTEVPYAKPGIELAHAILSARSERATTDAELIVLRNHGLITAADTAECALELVADAEAALRARWGRDAVAPSIASAPEHAGWALLGPAGISDADAARLTEGPLTPDSAVFLGARPFTVDPTDHAASLLVADGWAYAAEGLSSDAREIGESFLAVARLFPDGAVNSLGDDRIAELIDWEAEKWRKAMER